MNALSQNMTTAVNILKQCESRSRFSSQETHGSEEVRITCRRHLPTPKGGLESTSINTELKLVNT